MIFVTIGTQEPFDRLIKVMDELASTIDEPVIAQVIGTAYEVRHMEVRGFLTPAEFERLFKEARLVVSHAGMGSIISALTTDKPIVVMPRKASIGEHRNEHQMATTAKFSELGYVHVAKTEDDLRRIVLDLLQEEKIEPLHHVGQFASDSLIRSLAGFIKEGN